MEAMVLGYELLFWLLTGVKIVLPALVSFGFGWWSVPYCISLAQARSIWDVPNSPLKTQKAPVPYLGGLAVLVAVYSALAVIMPARYNVSLMCIGALLLALLGLADDLKPLSPAAKFCGQSVITLCFIKGGFFAKQLVLTALAPFELVLCAIMGCSWLWIILVTNAFNVIDVMDGLCATVALGCCSSLAISAYMTQSPQALMVILAIMGGLVAFLRFNAPPARIYLGDSGSLFLGGLLSVIPFMISWQNSGVIMGMAVAISSFALPLTEVAALICIRTWLGLAWYRGSRHHFCHFLLDAGWSISSILQLVVAFSGGFAILGALFLQQWLTLGLFVFGCVLLEMAWISIVYRKYCVFTPFGLISGLKQHNI